MSHISKALRDAFPDDADALRQLKAADTHFQALAARFDTLDTQAEQIESGAEAGSDARLEDIKKYRLALLDEIAVLVDAAKAG